MDTQEHLKALGRLTQAHARAEFALHLFIWSATNPLDPTAVYPVTRGKGFAVLLDLARVVTASTSVQEGVHAQVVAHDLDELQDLNAQRNRFVHGIFSVFGEEISHVKFKDLLKQHSVTPFKADEMDIVSVSPADLNRMADDFRQPTDNLAKIEFVLRNQATYGSRSTSSESPAPPETT